MSSPEKGANEPKEPNAGEAKFFCTVVKHMDHADVKWDAVAADLGLKNDSIAKVRFGQIKRKLGIKASSESGSPTSKKTTTTTSASPSSSPANRVTKKPATPRKGRGIKKETAKLHQQPCEANDGEADDDDDDKVDFGVKREMKKEEDMDDGSGAHDFLESGSSDLRQE